MTPIRPLAAAIAALAAPALASAATITITTTASGINDSDGACSLHEAIENANSDSQNSRTGSGECAAGSGADTIDLPANQTITLTSALDTITSSVTITGNGATIERDTSLGCVINISPAAGEFGILDFTGSSNTLSLFNLTLAHGCSDYTSASKGGGALNAQGGPVELDGVVMRDNASNRGAALFSSVLSDNTITVRNSTVSDNTGSPAISVNERGLAMIDSTVRDNARGGVFLYQYYSSASSLISGSTISGNSNTTRPGGIDLYGGELTIEDSTISGNQTMDASSAGGIELSSGGTLTLSRTTISDNSGPTTGQIRTRGSTTLTVTGSIITGTGTACALSGTRTGSDNLASDSSCDALGTTVVSDSDLALGALADNGGPTQTRLPGPGSVAVDAASGCSGNDQRGLPRDVDADGSSGSDCDIGAVEVQNTVPTVVADSAGTDQDTDLDGNVLANDSDGASDEDSDLAVVAIDGVTGDVGAGLSPVAGGTLTIGADGSYSLVVGNDFTALDSGDNATISVAVTVSDGFASADANLDITVDGVNDAPAAAAVTGSVGESDAPATFAFAGSDPDGGETLTYTLVGSPSGGLITNLGDGNFSFNPNGAFEHLDAGFSTLVTLGYTLSDGDLTTSEATISITVNGSNDAPVANDLALSTTQGSNISGNASANDAESDPLSYSLETPPTAGSASVGSNGNVAFNVGNSFVDLDDGESRAASFQFRVIDDSGASDVGTVTVTVHGANDAPVADAVSGSVSEDGSATISLIANDVDGETLSYALFAAPSEGNASINGDGTVSFDPSGDFEDLPAGASRQASFQYVANDGSVDSAPASVTITVNGVNDAPVAADLAVSASDSGVTQANFSGSDVDAGDTLSYTLQSQPSQGMVTDNGDGSFSFDPNGQFDDLSAGGSRAVSFQYTVSDGIETSSTATVTVTVAGGNAAPTAADLALSTNQDSSVGGSFAGSDIDSDDKLSYLLQSQPAGGSVVDNGDGSFSFDPAGAFDDLDSGESREVSFQYRASDGVASSAAATVTVTVNGLNDAPVAAADSYSVTSGQTLNVAAAEGLLANDSDIDDEALTVTAGSFTPTGVGGTLVLASDGSFSYTPPPGISGTASVNYSLSDGTTTRSGTLSINVLSATALDLEISKSDGVDIVAADDVLTWTINVLNHGPADAVGARVQDILPADVDNASWTCEAVPPSAATACSNASGSGDIDQQVNIAAGDAIVFELMATMTAPSASTLSNTATVTAPDGFTDTQPGNNTATDTDATTRVFVSGFETTVVSKRFEARAMEFDGAALAASLPSDKGLASTLVGRATSQAGFVLVHARRHGGEVELRLSRYEQGEWRQGDWQQVEQARVRVEW